MTRQVSPNRAGARARRMAVGFAMSLGVLALCASGTSAHEDTQTHRRLGAAALELLGSPDINSTERQAVMDGTVEEDTCPNYHSHFYNPKTGGKLEISDSTIIKDPNCDPPLSFSDIKKTQTSALERAINLYQDAVNEFDEFDPVKRAAAFKTLGHVLHLLQDMTSPSHTVLNPHGKLGMTCNQDDDDFENWGWCPDNSTSHILDYVTNVVGTAETNCADAIDDDGDGLVNDGCPAAAHPESSFPIPIPEFLCFNATDDDGDGFVNDGCPVNILRLGAQTRRLKQPVDKLFCADPQDVDIAQGETAAGAFMKKVANTTYNFTTYQARLNRPALQKNFSNSLLKRMFPSLGDVLGGWEIDEAVLLPANNTENVGFTDGLCGRNEGALDVSEEWWLMEDPDGDTSQDPDETGDPNGCFTQGSSVQPTLSKGNAFIENAGGEGPLGIGVRDSLIPKVNEKALYQLLYGTTANTRDQLGVADGDTDCNESAGRNGRDTDCPKTLLRIYGDVLYTTAVVYGAGLIQAFLDDVLESPQAAMPDSTTGQRFFGAQCFPTAEAGGPYIGEMCQPVTFNAGSSVDANGDIPDPNGEIVEYAWDFDWGGNSGEPFDETTTSPQIEHTYFEQFTGLARLRVTDDDGLIGDDVAGVQIGPDKTPPTILGMTTSPSRLWPPSHKMTPVSVAVTVEDACDPDPQCQIVSVASNEPANARGAGKAAPDWNVTGGLTVDLRAERSGKGSERVYTITVQCTDDFGNAAFADTPVKVPHSMASSASQN